MAETVPTATPEGYLDVRGLAALAGQSPVSTRHQLKDCRERRAKTADQRWPTWIMPKPDSGIETGTAVWKEDRVDVQEWAADKRAAMPPALLRDRKWLLKEYGHPEGLHGRPKVRGGRSRSMAEMGKDLGVSRDTIRLALVREGIPVAVLPDGQRKGVRGKLALVPLEVLEAALRDHGTVAAAAASLDPPVSHLTFRTALRAKRAEAGL